jgi:hypothetical protein
MVHALTAPRLIYIFGLMTCDHYYETHPTPDPITPLCGLHEIEADTARSVALLSASMTLFGILNLFTTSWTIKAFGIKRSLLFTIFWPTLRLVVQNIGIHTGSGLGITIIQCSQVITVLGGPAGYLLACNSFAAEIVKPSERTATLGKLTGCALFGNSAGVLLGGLISDKFGLVVPFEVGVVAFLSSTIYAAVFLPHVALEKAVETKASLSLNSLFNPLRVFLPQDWRLPSGRTQREYGTLFVGIGVFLGVLATGYIPVLLQMYATDAFGFTPKKNGLLVSINCFVQGLFLTFAFPAIVSYGRKGFDSRTGRKFPSPFCLSKAITYFFSSPTKLTPTPDIDDDRTKPIDAVTSREDKRQYAFDLFYIKLSLLADGVLTSCGTFVNRGWQMYLIAVLIPLAAGASSLAKGTMLQMCEPEQRADALSAISLVEMMARLSTSELKSASAVTILDLGVLTEGTAGLFGLIFSTFAAIGKPHYTFALNGV